jgi:hypothetical protein
MSRIRLIILSLLAVFAIGAFGASSASAACNDGGHQSVFCYHDGKEITHDTLVGESGLSLLEGKSGGVAFTVHCPHDTIWILILALGVTHGEISFLDCSIAKPAGQGCTVPFLIGVEFLDQLSANIMPPTDLFKGLGANEEFSKFTIGGAGCTAKGSIVVEGLQTAELPGSETSGVEHEVVAKKSGSKLKIGGAVASFSSSAKVKLKSGLPWLIDLGS